MKTLTLERYSYSETETQGWLWIDETRLHTIERPWVGDSPGGVPFTSCIPDGSYDLEPFVRPNGDEVFRLRNADLGVYGEQAEVPPEGGRYLVLLHRGNFVDDVVGCIAPGKSRVIYENRNMVTSSRMAMQMIRDAKPTRINIECACGTEQ